MAAMRELTLSSKNQIVIPREARKALGLRAGDKLLVVAYGDKIIVMEKPKSFRKAIAGIGRELYPADYLKKERDSWE
jgi:AbrB family looped-hinge helix DNA binding protein